MVGQHGDLVDRRCTRRPGDGLTDPALEHPVRGGAPAPWEMAAVLAITSALSVATFWTDLPPSILILPTLAWAGFRLNMIGAAIAGAAAAFWPTS